MKSDSFKAYRWFVWLMICAIACAAATTTARAAEPQVQQPDSGGVAWSGAGIGAATMLADVVYVPVKFVYAALGGIAGGFAFVLTGGNTQVSDTIWRSALGGDYVLTPRMIAGEDPIHFSGPTQLAPSEAASSAGASASSAAANGGAAPISEAPIGGPAPMPAGASSSGGGLATTTTPIDRGAGPLNAPRALPTPDTSIQ
jgi:hypothetical protein